MMAEERSFSISEHLEQAEFNHRAQHAPSRRFDTPAHAWLQNVSEPNSL
jgi:hypothetical protein